MEIEVKRVQVIKTGKPRGRFGADATQHELVFTTPDADGARRFTIPVDAGAAREFELMAVRATPMEKL